MKATGTSATFTNDLPTSLALMRGQKWALVTVVASSLLGGGGGASVIATQDVNVVVMEALFGV